MLQDSKEAFEKGFQSEEDRMSAIAVLVQMGLSPEQIAKVQGSAGKRKDDDGIDYDKDGIPW